MTRCIWLAVWAAALFQQISVAEEPLADLNPFFEQHCTACHSGNEPSGNLNLDTLDNNLSAVDRFERWVRIYDRVEAGEMPPTTEPRPERQALTAFTTQLAESLAKAEQTRYQQSGRAGLRRLNRYEYEHAVRDLLYVPWAQIKDKLPDDGEAYRFNKTGRALDVSHVQMSRYLSSAEYAMLEVLAAAWKRPEKSTKRYYARDEFSLIGSFKPRENSTLPDRHSFPVLDSQAQPDVRAGRQPVSSPETREREAVGKVSSIFSDAGGYSWSQFRAPAAGTYRLKFKGYSIWVSGGGIGRWYYEGFGDEKTAVYYLPLWHRPNVDEVWPGRSQEPMSAYAQSSGQNRLLGEFDFAPEPSESELVVMLRAGEVVRTDGSRLFRTRVNGTGEQYVNPLATEAGMPGYAIQWMEVEGPLPDAELPRGYQLLFGDLALVEVDESMPGLKLPSSSPGGRAGGFGGRRDNVPPPKPTRVDVATQHPLADAERLLRAFLQRAYRRPVAESEVALFHKLFKDRYANGFGFAASMIAAYKAVLASPGFLFVEESPGQLTARGLATRLSLFLWNTSPDERLRELAASEELLRPEVLHAETERLLNDSRSKRFVEAFTDYWLDLREIDDNAPSTTLYNDYELDDPLKLAAVAETRLFVAELLKEDLPARNIVDSDFTFLNQRLAQHYGIDGVSGSQMRRVALDADSTRGGLMTQASVLKVTANGTTTSPVLRGVWVTERILGFETPPPPPVPAVEPDIRGAVTIRQQIEAHRADASCAACHARMDPPGLALESFDVMGAWRDRYRAVNDDVAAEAGVGLDGQKFKFHYALPVDASGVMPDGSGFDDIRTLKAILIADETQIARNVARQLITYATGAPVGFSDRQTVEQILAKASISEYGFRSLVHEVVQSKLFRHK